MVHLMLAWVLAREAAVRPSALHGTQIYQLALRPDRLDYQLQPPPGPGPCRVVIAGAAAPGKSKLVFTAPLAAGSYRLDVRPSKLPGDRTIVFSVPLQGEATFAVALAGEARYDFSFRMASGKEYRFTVTAPAEKTFHLSP